MYYLSHGIRRPNWVQYYAVCTCITVIQVACIEMYHDPSMFVCIVPTKTSTTHTHSSQRHHNSIPVNNDPVFTSAQVPSSSSPKNQSTNTSPWQTIILLTTTASANRRQTSRSTSRKANSSPSSHHQLHSGCHPVTSPPVHLNCSQPIQYSTSALHHRADIISS